MKKTICCVLVVLLFYFINFSITRAQWIPQVSGTNSNLYSMDFINHNIGFCVGSGGIIIKTTNGGTNWTTIPCPITANFNYVKMFGYDNIIIGVNDTNIFLKSTDGGINWILYTLPEIPIELQFVSFTNGFFIINNVGYLWDFYRTTDGGQNWIHYGFQFWGEYGYNKDIYFINESTGWLCRKVDNYFPYVSGSILVYKTSNAGENWSYIYGKGSHFGNSMTYRIFFVNSNLGFLTEYPYSECLYRTTNGGNNFQHIPGSGYEKNYYSISFPSIDTGWFTGDQTIKTVNGGVNWDTITTPGGNNYKSIFFVNNLTGWIAGDGGLIAKTTNGATNINGISNKILESFILHQNYPNPFNPITNIKFDIPKSSFVKMVVYNSLGQEVTTLVNEKLNAGSYEVDWNGTNYPGGVYFYRLESRDYINVKKMILVK